MASALAVLQQGLLHMRPLQYWLKPRVPACIWRSGLLCVKVDHGCIKALASWKDPGWYQTGVDMGLVSRRKVVTTDASNWGWGALCKGRPASDSWSSTEQRLHINCLEMMVLFWTSKPSFQT